MDKDISKQKNTVMKSIMGNAKLARTFNDALNSPLGSTKRDNARSTLSIIGKLGGTNGQGGQKYYGMGGPITPTSTPAVSSGYTDFSGGNNNNQDDFSNMFIFPAAPKLKNQNLSLTSTTQNNSNNSLMPWDLNSNTSNPPVIPPTKTASTTPNNNSGNMFSNLGGFMTNNSSYHPVTPAPGVSDPFYLNTIFKGVGDVGYNLATGAKSVGSMLWDSLPGMVGAGPAANVGPVTGGQTTAQGFLADPKTIWANLSSTKPVASEPVVSTGTATSTSSTTGPNKNLFSSLASSTNNVDGVVSGATNIAANSVAKILGITPDTAYAQVPVLKLAEAIATNEGFFNGTSTVAIKNNNPGNLKFAGQAGATQDDKGFAVFATPEAGAQALVNDLTAKYNSGKYKTINDIMSVYSPDSDNPANPDYSSDPTKKKSTSTTPLADKTITDAQAAVNVGMGPGTFALNAVNAKFGGSLPGYIDNIDKQKKEEFGLDKLENDLTTLKNEKGNIIPTLQQYIAGKDQYLKFIDQMLANTNENIANADMSDPDVANAAKQYKDYLLTLQGRQNQRYGTYLNSMIADYNTDVQNAQTNYDNVYKRYQTAMTSEGNIAQAEYQNLYQAMGDLYNTLDQMPTKILNKQLLEAQLSAANIQIAQNLKVASGNTSEWLKEQTQYKDHILDSIKDPVTEKTTNILKPSAELNLEGIYQNVMNNGLSPAGVTDMVAQGATNGINSQSSSQKSIEVAADYRKMINSLAQSNAVGPNGVPLAQYAIDLAPTIAQASSNALYKYVLADAKTIKSAIQDLVTKSGWFGGGKSGLEDKNTWTTKYKNIPTEVLEGIYNATKASMATGDAYAKNPALIFTMPAGDNTGNISNLSDQNLAGVISSMVGSMWASEPTNIIMAMQTQPTQ